MKSFIKNTVAIILAICYASIANAQNSSRKDPNDPCGGKGYIVCNICNGAGTILSGNYLTGYFSSPCYFCFGNPKLACGYCAGKASMLKILQDLKKMTPREREIYLQNNQFMIQQNLQFLNAIKETNQEYRDQIREIERHTQQKLRELKSWCSSCSGTGRCSMCNGSGTVSNLYTSGFSSCTSCMKYHPGKCSRCNGTGKLY